jgi:putative transposase
MTILEQNENSIPEMPRFSDGSVNLQELIRVMAESLVNAIMDAQADDMCEQGNQRNGYRKRGLMTCVGKLNLQIPKLRMGTYFPNDILMRYSRTDKAVIAAISEMVTSGVSTRKVSKVATKMGIDKMSSSQVSRICESLDACVADLQERDLSGVLYPYIFLDATYIKCRDAGHVSSTALVSAIGVDAKGYRHILGLDAIDSETYEGWAEFLKSLRSRGVAGVACVTSDAHEGLKRAISEAFPGAAWQRCIVHLERNAAGCATNKTKRSAIYSILHAVFAEDDPPLVRELYHQACEEIEKFCPRAALVLEEAEADALAYLDFPFEHHKRIRTNNIQERANRELKRRSHVVQVFPSRKALIRMMGAVYSEMDEDWQSKRMFAEDVILQVVHGDPCKPPTPAYAGNTQDHARHILELVLADNPFDDKVA